MSKQSVNVYEAMFKAEELIQSAGFMLAYAVPERSSSYYEYPGRIGHLKVTAHGAERKRITDGADVPVVSKLTFASDIHCEPDCMKTDPDKIPNGVAAAIGRYFMKAGIVDIASAIESEDHPND